MLRLLEGFGLPNPGDPPRGWSLVMPAEQKRRGYLKGAADNL